MVDAAQLEVLGVDFPGDGEQLLLVHDVAVGAVAGERVGVGPVTFGRDVGNRTDHLHIVVDIIEDEAAALLGKGFPGVLLDFDE